VALGQQNRRNKLMEPKQTKPYLLTILLSPEHTDPRKQREERFIFYAQKASSTVNPTQPDGGATEKGDYFLTKLYPNASGSEIRKLSVSEIAELLGISSIDASLLSDAVVEDKLPASTILCGTYFHHMKHDLPSAVQ
jgi:hypothetical protein